MGDEHAGAFSGVGRLSTLAVALVQDPILAVALVQGPILAVGLVQGY